MTATWVIGDTHFGHENACTVFKRKDGLPLRPFKNADEMDQCMIARWNERVGSHDCVYHLGDVAINKKHLWKISQLAGRIILLAGNHDIFPMKSYIEAGFEEVRAYKVMHRAILSHIPIHKGSMVRWEMNIHGHLHANEIEDDAQYLCVSAEHTDFAPITIDECYKRVEEKQRRLKQYFVKPERGKDAG